MYVLIFYCIYHQNLEAETYIELFDLLSNFWNKDNITRTIDGIKFRRFYKTILFMRILTKVL